MIVELCGKFDNVMRGDDQWRAHHRRLPFQFAQRPCGLCHANQRQNSQSLFSSCSASSVEFTRSRVAVESEGAILYLGFSGR